MKLFRFASRQEGLAANPSPAVQAALASTPTPEIIYNAKGKQLNISVSAANTWDDCNLKWLFDYYYKMPRVEKESTRTGNGVHDVLETYLKKGEWKFEGKPLPPKHRYRVLAERGVKASGLTVIPGKGVQDGWETEEWTPEGIYCGPLRFKGKVDIHRVTSTVGRVLEVWDWKTAKDPLASYNPTPISLAYLRQPLAYGYVMSLKYGLQGQPFQASYIYMATVGNAAFKMDADELVPWDRVTAEWATLEGIAGGMAKLAKEAEGQDPAAFVHKVSHRTGACKKYGGCGRQGVCPFSPENRTNPAYVNPVIAQSIDPEKLTMTTPNGLAALAALAGVSQTPAASITPAATPIVAATVPPPPATDPAGQMTSLVSQLKAMLAGGPFAEGIPGAVLEGMAAGVGVQAAAAAAAAGLVNEGGVYKLPSVVAAVTPNPKLTDLLPLGSDFGEATAVAESLGTSIPELIAQLGYVFAFGLYILPEDQVQATAMGAAGVGWVYEKYKPSNDGVAAATSTIAQVEAAAPVVVATTAPATGGTEVEATVAWLEAQDWPAEGLKVRDILAALKAGPLAHRQRLGVSFLEKALKVFNGATPAILEVKADRKTVGPTDLALASKRVALGIYPDAAPQTDVIAEQLAAEAAAKATTVPAPGSGLAALAASMATPTVAAPVKVATTVAQDPAAVQIIDAPITIYVDVYAEGGLAAVTLEAWSEQYTDQVMEYARQQAMKGCETGVWQLVEYGKGAGLWARVFRTCFAQGQVPAHVLVDSDSSIAATFLAAARAAGNCLILRGK